LSRPIQQWHYLAWNVVHSDGAERPGADGAGAAGFLALLVLARIVLMQRVAISAQLKPRQAPLHRPVGCVASSRDAEDELSNALARP
jgi:hypothetical protein